MPEFDVYTQIPLAGLRPGAAAAVHLTDASVTMSAGTYEIASLHIWNLGDVPTGNFFMKEDATLIVNRSFYMGGCDSQITLAGKIYVNDVTWMYGSGSAVTLSGELISSGKSEIQFMMASSSMLITGLIDFSNTTGSPLTLGGYYTTTTVAAGAVINAKYSLQLKTSAYQNFYIDGGQVNVHRFYGQRVKNYLGSLANYHMKSGTFSHFGWEAELTGKDHDNTGVVVFNQSGGLVVMNQGGGTFNLTGQKNANDGGKVCTLGVGIYNLSGGRLVLHRGISYGVVGQYAENADAVRIDEAVAYSGYAGGQFNFTGGELQTESLSIHLDNKGGTLIVGLDDAQGATLFGAEGMTYSQSAASSLALDFIALDQYDKLDYTGALSSVFFEDGTHIRITLADGFSPENGEQFDIVQAALLSGNADMFNIWINGVLTSDWTAEILGSTTLRLKAPGIPEPAFSAGLIVLLALVRGMRRR